jgi:Protein of unknown function (DUF3014)
MAAWSKLGVAVLSAAVVAGGGWWWWKQKQAAPAVASVEAPVAAPAPAVSPAASAPPAVRYPIEAAASEPTEVKLPASPADADKLVGDALVDLIGRKDVQTFLQIDGVVRRFVATVDNLGRSQAPARLWPVQPTPGRFSVVNRTDGPWMADTNAERYIPFVRLASGVDAARAVALYVRLYPLFQRAYEELGYPGRHFNDRLVDVIDMLLQTPDLATAPKLKLTQVQGPIPDARPWLRYEFDDPALEARPAGQKVLMRMGSRNQRLLKDKLREFRARIAKP